MVSVMLTHLLRSIMLTHLLRPSWPECHSNFTVRIQHNTSNFFNSLNMSLNVNAFIAAPLASNVNALIAATWLKHDPDFHMFSAIQYIELSTKFAAALL